MDDYLTKPFTSKQLAAVLRRSPAPWPEQRRRRPDRAEVRHPDFHTYPATADGGGTGLG